MAQLRRSHRGAIASSRRRTSWSGGPNQDPTNLSAAGATLWGIGAQAALDGLTLVRVRGVFQFVQTVTTTVLDGFAKCAIGICVVAENAFDAGIGSVPTPITDDGWDGWLYHQWVGEFVGLSTSELGTWPSEAVRADIDSKAMRKLRATDVICGVVELGTEVGAATLRFSAETRILVKLA